VYSELDRGTTFKIYLPASEGPALKIELNKEGGKLMKGSETILLVEDDQDVRQLTSTILKRQGYNLLEAQSGAEAMLVLASHEGPVDLLLTDVIMPNMSGSDLYELVAEKYPETKVLYMSGYTDNVIAHQGILKKGVKFIQKPFTVQGLGVKVREVLDQD
jgi:DNA-binding NtrC family response regulator